MDVRQTEHENKPLLSLYDRFAYVTCSHCIFFKGSDKIWKIGAGVVLGEFVACNGLEM